MKLSPRQVDDLLTLTHHAKKDIDYGWGGTYGGFDEDNKEEAKKSNKEVRQSERAIELIRKIILERN